MGGGLIAFVALSLGDGRGGLRVARPAPRTFDHHRTLIVSQALFPKSRCFCDVPSVGHNYDGLLPPAGAALFLARASQTFPIVHARPAYSKHGLDMDLRFTTLLSLLCEATPALLATLSKPNLPIPPPADALLVDELDTLRMPSNMSRTEFAFANETLSALFERGPPIGFASVLASWVQGRSFVGVVSVRVQ